MDNAIRNASDYDLNSGLNADEIESMQIDEPTSREAATQATEGANCSRIRLGEEILDDHIEPVYDHVDAEPAHAHMSDTLYICNTFNENKSPITIHASTGQLSPVSEGIEWLGSRVDQQIGRAHV